MTSNNTHNADSTTSYEEAKLAELEAEAELYRKRGFDRDASLLESVLNELREAREADLKRRVPLSVARELSGYTTRQLRRHIESGKLENVNDDPDAPPEVEVGALPIRPGHNRGPRRRGPRPARQSDRKATVQMKVLD